MSAAALEARLRSHPHDEASWLVYGDWLTDRGDDRGQLIRLEQRAASATGDEKVSLVAEIDALVARSGTQWSAGLEEIQRLFDERREHWDPLLKRSVDLVWRHGFLVAAAVPCEEGSPYLVERLLAHPSARLLSGLAVRPGSESALDDDDGDDGVARARASVSAHRVVADILGCDLARLTTLDLGHLALGDAAVRALVGATRLTSVQTLDLRYNWLGDEFFVALRNAAHFSSVKRLYLQRNGIGPAGASAFADSPHLRELRHLDLRYNFLGEQGAAALARSPNVAKLEQFAVYQADVGPEGRRALASSGQLPLHLRRYWMAHDQSR